ncbi:MAG: cytochrome c oxidase assembly protein [Gemmatimonadales bacterium]
MTAAPFAWWHWEFHPSVVIGVVLLGGLYVLLGGASAPRRRVAAFAASLLVVLASLNGPLHDLSDRYLFSAHMVQHLILTLLFPPLFLYGISAQLARRVIRLAWARAIGARLVQPIPAATIFTVPIVLWHLPPFYEAAMRHHGLHIVQHLVFLATAVLMWWPVLSPLPELPRASYPGQLLYLFLLGIPMSVVGAMITLADAPLYPFYVAAPRVIGLSPLDDQQIGGLVMWVPGGLVFWVAMTVVWFRWSVREDRGDAERQVPPEAYGLSPKTLD